MSKTIYKSLVIWAVILGFHLVGCTRNNGDIGAKFGSWKLSSMTIDGTENPDYEGNIFWGFQNNSLSFTTVTDTEGVPANNIVFTDWHEADGYIIINTALSDGQGTFRYTPPAVLLLPEQTADIRLKICSESSRKMELEYITSGGQRVVYTLRKWS